MRERKICGLRLAASIIVSLSFAAAVGISHAIGVPIVFVGEFVNKTGDAAYDGVAAGLGIHLASTLASSGAVRVVTHESRRAALAEARLAISGMTAPDATAAACELSGADVALTGSYALIGDELLLGVELISAISGEVRALPPIYCGKSDLKALFMNAGEGVLGLLFQSDMKGVPESFGVESDSVSLDVLSLKGEIDAALFGEDGRMRKDLSAAEIDALIELCEKVIESEPEDAFAHNCLGALYGIASGAGDPEKAAYHYRRAIETAPWDAAAYSNLGAELARGGDIEEAVECYREAIRLNPRYAPAHYNLALVHLGKGDYEDAETELQNAVLFDRGYYAAFYFLGKVRRFLDKPLEAAQAYESFFGCAPKRELEKHVGLWQLVEQLKLEAQMREAGVTDILES